MTELLTKDRYYDFPHYINFEGSEQLRSPGTDESNDF